VRRVGDIVGMHPLALDDVLHEGQRPRAEEYGDHLFLLMRMLLVQNLAVPPGADSATDTRAGRAANAALDGRATAQGSEGSRAERAALLAAWEPTSWPTACW